MLLKYPGCFLRAIWWGWEKMKSWRRRTRTSHWGPEGWREDKSLWVWCVQGEIRQTRCFQSWGYWHFLAQGAAPTPPGRWGPSTPVTRSTANLRAAENEPHGRAWSRSAPGCLPWESYTPLVCSQLYSLRALWPYQGEEPWGPRLCPPSSLGNAFGCSPVTGHWWDVALSTLNFSAIGFLYSGGRYSFPDLPVIVLHPSVSLKAFLGPYSWVHIPREAASSIKWVTAFTKRIHSVSLTLLHSLSIL